MAGKSTEQIVEHGDLEVPIPPHFRELEHQPIVGEKLLFFEFNYDKEKEDDDERYKEILFWLVVVEDIENNRITFSRLRGVNYDLDDNLGEAKMEGLFSARIDCFRQPLKCKFCSIIYPVFDYYDEGSPDLGESDWIWFFPDNGSEVEISISCDNTECKTQISFDDLDICPPDIGPDEYLVHFHVLVYWKNKWVRAIQIEPGKIIQFDTFEVIQCENYRHLSEYGDNQWPISYYFNNMSDFLRTVFDWDISLSLFIHKIPNFSLDESLKAIDFNPGLYCYVRGESRNNDGKIESVKEWKNRNRFEHREDSSDFERWLRDTRDEREDFRFNFQSLPSEFDVDEKGTVKLASYINGVFLSSNDCVAAKIEKTVEHLIPLMENVGELSLKGERIQLIIQSIGNRERGDFEWHCGNVNQEHIILSAMLFFEDCEISIRQESSVDVLKQICTYHECKVASYSNSTGFMLCNSFVLGSETVRKHECIIMKDRIHQVKMLGAKCEGICFMLVDPYDRIPSTADVPCQRCPLKRELLMIVCKKIFDRVPYELRNLILSFLELNGFSVEDAMNYERKYYNEKRDYMHGLDRYLSTEFYCPENPFAD